MELPYNHSCLHNWVFDGILRQDIYFIKSRKGDKVKGKQRPGEWAFWKMTVIKARSALTRSGDVSALGPQWCE